MRGRAFLLAAVSLLATSSVQVKSTQKATGAGQTYTSADVDQALKDAEQFARDGKYEQALERHLWYHKNALKFDPAQAGVRLSFALADWADLGKAYPKALHALRAVRNETLATYRRAPSESFIFGEVMSIDFAINDLRSAKLLFYEGQKHGVRDDLLLELNRIVDAGELKWASDVMGDPNAKLNEIKRERDTSVAALSGHKELVSGVDGMYAEKIVNLLKAVAKVKGLPTARRVQKKALGILDSPGIRNALASG